MYKIMLIPSHNFLEPSFLEHISHMIKTKQKLKTRNIFKTRMISSKRDVVICICLLVQEHLRLPQDFKIRTNEVTILVVTFE